MAVNPQPVRVLIVAAPAPDHGPVVSWNRFVAGAEDLLGSTDCLVLTGPLVTFPMRPGDMSVECPLAWARVDLNEMREYGQFLTFDSPGYRSWRRRGGRLGKGPGATHDWKRCRVQLGYRHRAIREWAKEDGRTLVLLLPVPVMSAGIRGHTSGHLAFPDRFTKDALKAFAGESAAFARGAGPFPRRLAKSLPLELWARGLRPLLAPAIIDSGARRPLKGTRRLFPLVRSPDYPPQGGYVLVGQFERAKMLVAATRIWLGFDLGAEEYIRSPLLRTWGIDALVRAAEWFHSKAPEELEGLAMGTSRCPHEPPHRWPRPGPWQLDVQTRVLKIPGVPAIELSKRQTWVLRVLAMAGPDGIRTGSLLSEIPKYLQSKGKKYEGKHAVQELKDALTDSNTCPEAIKGALPDAKKSKRYRLVPTCIVLDARSAGAASVQEPPPRPS